jgi:predicted nucleotidyltransferase
VTQFGELLRVLASSGVDFVVVGGVAAAAHGAARATQDLDILYGRRPENLHKLVQCLLPLHPYLRGAPPDLPFQFDLQTVQAGLNFTLTTDLGWIDLLGEIAGGRYEDLAAQSILIEAFGVRCRVLDLETLIRTKTAAGRPKDFEGIAELEIVLRRSRDKK